MKLQQHGLLFRVVLWTLATSKSGKHTLINLLSGPDFANSSYSASWDRSTQAAFQVLCSKADLTECAVDMIFPDAEHVLYDPSQFEWYITQGLNNTCMVLDEWYGSVLYVEAAAWARIISDTTEPCGVEKASRDEEVQRKYWETHMIRSIRNGANIHYCDQDRSTLLGDWVQTFHPLTTQNIIRHWLSILQSCGVDTTKYIYAELQLFLAHQRLDTWKETGIRKRKIDIVEQCGVEVTVSWKGEFPGPCAQVLDEFLDLGDDECFSPFLKYSLATEQDWRKFWPFSYNSVPNRGTRRQEPTRRSRRTQRQRHLQIVRTKLSSAEMEPLKIPGSWVD